MGRTQVCYLYGVTTDGSRPGHQVPGIDKAPVKVLAGDGIAALASALPSEGFGPDAWRDHADDVVWLSNVARNHHDVLQHAAADIDVVPLRVPTMFADEGRARDMLSAQLAALQAALGRISGRLEWGVKVFDGNVGKEPGRPGQGRVAVGPTWPVAWTRPENARSGCSDGPLLSRLPTKPSPRRLSRRVRTDRRIHRCTGGTG